MMNSQSCRAVLPHITSRLKALAHESRLLLLTKLAEGESDVSTLGLACNISQPTLSQQLTILRRAGLIRYRRMGKNKLYQLSDPCTLNLIQQLQTLFKVAPE